MRSTPPRKHLRGTQATQADTLIRQRGTGTTPCADTSAGLEAVNPELIFARISGYGQNGPNSSKPGYASVTEAYSGFRYVNGFPGEVPVRPNLSIGDTVAGIHAVLGILLALLERRQNRGTGEDQR